MNTLFSIIIPVWREEGWVGACLERLDGMRRIDQAEVILVDGDGGSTLRAVAGRSSSFSLRCLVSPPGRGVQMNAGAGASTGRFLVFLHVDTRLPADALALIERALRRSGAGAFTLKIDTTHPWLRLGARLGNLRTRVTRVPFGDQTLFLRRELFFTMGCYPPVPLMEDVALMLALKRRGIRPVILPERSITSDRRWKKEGVYRGTFRNWALYLLYRAGVPAGRLSRRYLPQNTSRSGE